MLAALLASLALAAPPDVPVSFGDDLRPVLARACFPCHGDDGRRKGGLDLARFATGDEARREPRLFREAIRRVRDEEMPPARGPALGFAERALIVRGLAALLDPGDGPIDPGPTPLRRLSRDELGRTIRDLLAVDVDVAAHLPSEGGGGEGFDNAADTLFVSPLFVERLLGAVDAAVAAADLSPWESRDDPVAAFARRAFRRPIDEADLAPYRGRPFADAVRAMLVAPTFLFRIEGTRAPADGDAPGAVPVDDHALAARLSYLLWSTAPDETLLARADAGGLRTAEGRAAAVARMVADPRSVALAERFAAQWLGFDRLVTTSAPDRRRFPTFTPALRDAMAAEATLSFDRIVREDRPVFELLDADGTFLNATLAAHYGIDGVEGDALRWVAVDDRRRGGVLGMGAVLTATSFPLRTSPVVRGAWVLETLLGTPPPPPPPDAGTLPADDVRDDGLSPKARLEAHRKREECASCHRRIDPIGFALEPFDPIGRWRDAAAGQPIDATGALPGGPPFEGPVGLKEALLARREAFARTFVERLLGYALGRGLEAGDERSVRAIVDALLDDDGRSSVALLGVVESVPFRYRRAEAADDAPPGGEPR